MLKIGARPKGRLIEQHDIVFAVVDDFTQVIDIINSHWQEVRNKWHIDAWREVTRVGNFRIQLSPKQIQGQDLSSENKLFFVNLGGYLPAVFEEFHYKELVVAPSIAQATAQVKKGEFYKTYDLRTPDPLTGINGVSHVDDKLAVDVDEIHRINDLLQGYSIQIIALTEAEKLSMPVDEMHIGYLSIKKIKNFFVEN